MQLLKTKITKQASLIKWRKEKNIERNKMADILGVGIIHYCNIENGNARMPTKTAIILHQLTGIAFCELVPDLHLKEKEIKQAMEFLTGKK